jgi:GT2 family glycosyltransferase
MSLWAWRPIAICRPADEADSSVDPKAVTVGADARTPGQLRGTDAGYCVGIVNHHSYADLAACLESVEAQTWPPAAILVMDVDADGEWATPLRAAHPDVIWHCMSNRGYGAAANRLLAEADRICPGAAHMLLLNADIELAREFGEDLLRAMEEDPRAALATGKLLRPGGHVLDSAGIRMGCNRRPRDRGSEDLDVGQFDRAEAVFAASGAALLLRRSALEEISLDGEVFDEDFFLYYEDTDLCWRAKRLGWRVLYEPRARAIHARGWRRDRRREVPVAIRRHSFKNHHLQILKNERSVDLLWRLPVLLGWEVLRFGFVLLREPELLPAYGDSWRLARRTLHKRRILQRRVRARRRLAASDQIRGESRER